MESDGRAGRQARCGQRDGEGVSVLAPERVRRAQSFAGVSLGGSGAARRSKSVGLKLPPTKAGAKSVVGGSFSPDAFRSDHFALAPRQQTKTPGQAGRFRKHGNGR
ncbi:hypothetical protein [Lysobacter gummosus]|uniref:hypothetical protein n=1 Tax=Lysobacter gummosus TaxID=262324 RepID=UPI00362E452A